MLFRLFSNRLFAENGTSPEPEQFNSIVRAAFRQFVDDCIEERLQIMERGDAASAVGKRRCITDEEFEKCFVVDVTCAE